MQITHIITVGPEDSAGHVKALTDAGLILQTDGRRTILCERLIRSFYKVDARNAPAFGERSCAD